MPINHPNAKKAYIVSEYAVETDGRALMFLVVETDMPGPGAPNHDGPNYLQLIDAARTFVVNNQHLSPFTTDIRIIPTNDNINV